MSKSVRICTPSRDCAYFHEWAVMSENYCWFAPWVTKPVIHVNPYIILFLKHFRRLSQKTWWKLPSINRLLMLTGDRSVVVLWRHTNTYCEGHFDRLSSECFYIKMCHVLVQIMLHISYSTCLVGVNIGYVPRGSGVTIICELHQISQIR